MEARREWAIPLAGRNCVPFSDRYDSLAEMLLPEARRLELGLWEGATFADAVVKSIYEAAIDGDTRAAREIRESIEGRCNARTEAAGSQFEFVVQYEKFYRTERRSK